MSDRKPRGTLRERSSIHVVGPPVKRECPQCHAVFLQGEDFCPTDGSRLRDPDVAREPGADPWIGQTIARRFLLTRRLGRGGMGVVYQATHLFLNRPCAVKLLHRRHVSNERILTRFMREARVASALDHEHIVTIYDYGQTEQGEPYLVMEFVEGRTLHRELAQSGKRGLPLPRVVDIAVQTARALCHAHERGVIHRDIKPENILLTDREGNEDFVKVLDFGLAKSLRQPSLTLTGQEVMGTPEFMAPEMIRNPEKAAAPVDLYAFGVLLYEQCSGAPPFGGGVDEILIGQLTRPAPPLVIPEQALPAGSEALLVELPRLVAQLLDKDPEARPTAAALLEALLRLQAQLPRRSLRSKLLATVGRPSRPPLAPPEPPAPEPEQSAPTQRLPTLGAPGGAAFSAAQTLILPRRAAAAALQGALLDQERAALSRAQTLLFKPGPAAGAAPVDSGASPFLAPRAELPLPGVRTRVTPPTTLEPPGAAAEPVPLAEMVTGERAASTPGIAAGLRAVDGLESRLAQLRAVLTEALAKLAQRIGERGGPTADSLHHVAACQRECAQHEPLVAALEREEEAARAQVQREQEALRSRLRPLQERLKFDDTLTAPARAGLQEQIEDLERQYFACPVIINDGSLRERLLQERLALHQAEDELHRAILTAARLVLDTTWPAGQQDEHLRLAEVLERFDQALDELEGLMPASDFSADDFTAPSSPSAPTSDTGLYEIAPGRPPGPGPRGG